MATSNPTLTESTVAQSLPELEDGEIATIVQLEVKERKTKPPSHYTEGLLLADMEGAAKFIENEPDLKRALKAVSGLGTAATRDSVIEGLKHDKYLEKSGKHMVATPKGIAFIQWLEKVMPELTDVATTARWEAELGMVAQQGGGKAFEDRVTATVIKLISILKAAPSLGVLSSSSPTSKENKKMSDNTSQKANKPTDKMLEYAKSIAKKVNVRVPDDVMTDYDTCKAFIDANKDAALRPSDKQLNFAKVIAERKGLEVPAEALVNGKDLSKWIDEHV